MRINSKSRCKTFELHPLSVRWIRK